MIYIKLDESMNLVTTVYEPIYRGDHLNKKIVYLVPLQVGDIDVQTAVVYLSFVRADGEADIVMLDRQEDLHNETYFQYTLPVTCKLSKYAGEVLTWMQIYSGSASDPVVAKSGENVIRVLESKNMDDYIGDWRSDKVLTALYQMKKQTDDAIGQNASDIEELQAIVAVKADNLKFDPEDSTIQLTADGEPVGEKIYVNAIRDKVVTKVAMTADGEMMIFFSDGTYLNLGVVRGKDGKVYVPHVDEHKILTFTIEDKEGEVPDPVDLNPDDEWSGINGEPTMTDYVWEKI